MLIPENVAIILLRALVYYPLRSADDRNKWESAWKWVEDHRDNVEEMGQ